MSYDAPGRADELSDELRARWTDTVARAFHTQAERLKTRFFSLDPGALREPRRSDAVKWPGDPGKPAYCVGEGAARRRAAGDDVFSAFGVEHLACNHSDPTISRRSSTTSRSRWAPPTSR